MRCLRCVRENLKNQQITLSVVQMAVDGARTGVVVRNGESICTEHLYNIVIEEAIPVQFK